MLDLFDHSVIISAQDREYIYHPWRDRIAVIPNGVDSEHFTPRHGRQDHDIVFTGNMNYPPNIDSALYLAQQILPLVRRTRPNTTLLISGVAPSQSVRDLGRTDPLIHVSGWVKDIRDSYASARLFVAPMQIGTGLQNKLLEAMAMRIPCITSTLANNAVGARPGDAILVGNSPEEYAAHILHLLDDPAERARIAENGYQFIRSQFDWDKAAEKLDRMISQGA
jgi:glycosyltransferase involved in cell wall biosynthesis